jgi:hypothetical protein
MNDFASLAPAQGPMAGVPAGAQQSPASQTVEAAKSRRTARKGSKGHYKLKTRRRGEKDPYPGERESDTPLQNVERIFHWVERGAATNTQRKVWWQNVRMNVDKAHADMVRKYPGSCTHLNRGCCRNGPCRQDLAPPQQQAFVLPVHMPRPPPQGPESFPTQRQGIQHPFFFSPRVFMPAQQHPSSAGHSTGYFQDTVLGIQPPFSQYEETFGSLPQASVGMPKHTDFFQGQDWEYQNPALQGLPVSMPVSQSPSGTGHDAEVLLVDPQHFETAVPSPGWTNPLALGMPEGFQSQSSSSLGSSPDTPAFWGNDWAAIQRRMSAYTDVTVPDLSEGLQDKPPESDAGMAGLNQGVQDVWFELSGVGTQFQIGAVGNLPADDSEMLDGLWDAAAFDEQMTQDALSLGLLAPTDPFALL